MITGRTLSFHGLITGILLLSSAGCAAPAPKKLDFAKDTLAIEAAFRKCEDSVGGAATASMAWCAGGWKSMWAHEVDSLFNRLRIVSDTGERAGLKAVHLKWLSLRDEEMEFCWTWYADDKGTLGRLNCVMCQGEVYRTRALWLWQLLSERQ
jgi:hypothetical protein